MSMVFHCPYRQSNLLQQALAPNKMRVAFLLGAGCPVSIKVEDENGWQSLIPDIRGLTKVVNDKLTGCNSLKKAYFALLKRLDDSDLYDPTVEDMLSHIRALSDVVGKGNIEGLDKKMLTSLDVEICKITTDVVAVELPDENTPYHQLATWVRGIQRIHPVEVFTPNYDLLMEQAFEAGKVPYFDGFIGSKRAFFDLTSMESESLPSRWARLWKVHGSVNWWRQPVGKSQNEFEVVRAENGSQDGRQMIYPSHLKYDQSRRLPYLAMLDRLREYLARGQGILVTCGYSFADQHLNEVILHGLRSNPTAVCFGLVYGPRAAYENVILKAIRHPNLSLLAADGAVLGGVEGNWRVDEQPGHLQHGLSVAKKAVIGSNGGEASGCEFMLGDFKIFGKFLARQLSRSDDDQVTTDAT